MNMKTLKDFFYPFSLTEKITAEGQSAHKEEVKQWQQGNWEFKHHRNTNTLLTDRAIRLNNWRTVGPLFKGYAIRWTCITIFFLILSEYITGWLILEIIFVLALLGSGCLSAIHWMMHKGYKYRIKAGQI